MSINSSYHIPSAFHFRYCFFIVVLLVLLCFPVVEKLHAEEVDLSFPQFAKEAATAWKQIADSYRKCSNVQFTLSTLFETGTRVDVCLLGNNELGSSRYKLQSGQYRELRNVINPRYSFNIQQDKKDDENSSWLLQNMWTDSFHLRENSSRESAQFSHGLLQQTAYLFEPVMVECSWLWNVVESEKMKVITLKKRTIDNYDCIELQFQCEQFYVDKYTKLLEGTILFDSSRYFVIKEYNVQTEFVADGLPLPKGEKNSGSMFLRIEKKLAYQNVNGIPYPLTSRTTADVEKLTLKKDIFQIPEGMFTNIDYEIVNGNKVDESVFRMSHYGFSEPEDPNRRLNIVRIVLMTAGVLLILFGLYLRWFAKKK